jgi:autophagy-related protein 16
VNQKRNADLEQQITNLKDERAELYKTQGTNAQRLLDLNDILRIKDETLASNKEEYVPSPFPPSSCYSFLTKR